MHADDNTICCKGSNLNDIKENIEAQSEIFVKWYRSNYMKVNADKFQAIIFGADSNSDVTFVIDDNDI